MPGLRAIENQSMTFDGLKTEIVSQYLWGIGSITCCGCSSPLYKMAYSNAYMLALHICRLLTTDTNTYCFRSADVKTVETGGLRYVIYSSLNDPTELDLFSLSGRVH